MATCPQCGNEVSVPDPYRCPFCAKSTERRASLASRIGPRLIAFGLLVLGSALVFAFLLVVAMPFLPVVKRLAAPIACPPQYDHSAVSTDRWHSVGLGRSRSSLASDLYCIDRRRGRLLVGDLRVYGSLATMGALMGAVLGASLGTAIGVARLRRRDVTVSR
jgi:hypothetical protein